MKSEQSVESAAAGVPRRRYGKEFKLRLVRMSLVPGASAAKIALKHQVNANLLFKWRRRYLREMTGPASDAVKLLPVTVRESSAEAKPAQNENAVFAQGPASTPCGSIEIELPKARIVVQGIISAELLRSVLQIVRSK